MSAFDVFEATTPEQREQLYRFRYQIFTLEQHKYGPFQPIEAHYTALKKSK